jgi:hypothetical protein
VPSRYPLKPDRPSRERRTENEGLDPPSGHAVVTEPPLQRNSGGPTSPAVKTSSPCLPPRSADRAVGGIRAEVENSGRRASATNDSTPIPTIRPKIPTIPRNCHASPPYAADADRAPLTRDAPPRSGGSVGRGCCRGGAVLPVDGRFFRGLITGPDVRTMSPERSRVGCSGVMQKTCHQQPHLVAIQLCSASTPRRLLGALDALTLLLRNGDDLRAGAQASLPADYGHMRSGATRRRPAFISRRNLSTTGLRYAVCAESAQADREQATGNLDAPGASHAIESCKQRSSSAAAGVSPPVSGQRRPPDPPWVRGCPY